MSELETKSSGLRERYTRMELYERPYGRSEITASELKECVRQKCEKRGLEGSIRSAGYAGRKKKYNEKTDQNVQEEYEKGKSIRKIAIETGCSIGYVQKLIYEHRYKLGRFREAVPQGSNPLQNSL